MLKKIHQKKSIDNVDIFIEKSDKDTKYENLNSIKSFLNHLITFTVSYFPFIVSKFIIKKSNKNAAHVHRNITTHSALDTLYETGVKFNKKNNFAKEIIEHLWFNLNNSKSVRNRLKLVKKLLLQTINLELERNNKHITIASLASGSARAVIETIAKFDYLSSHVYLLDRSSTALQVSKKIIQKNNLNEKNFSIIKDNVRNFTNHIKTSANIIEMVGLMDYLDEEKSILILKKIHNNLAPGGILITANIRDNSERRFVEKALKWMMIYREPDDLSNVLIKAGFKPENITIFYEPLLIHGVAIAKKD